MTDNNDAEVNEEAMTVFGTAFYERMSDFMLAELRQQDQNKTLPQGYEPMVVSTMFLLMAHVACTSDNMTGVIAYVSRFGHTLFMDAITKVSEMSPGEFVMVPTVDPGGSGKAN